MNPFFSPVLTMLLKWTVLLALGWTAHGLLRKRHCCWRLILWRGILCFSLVVPLMRFAPVPVLRIPIYEMSVSPAEASDVLPPAAAGSPLPKDKSTVPSPAKPAGANAVAKSLNPPPSQTAFKTVPWGRLLGIIWGLGTAFACFRLVRFQVQLNRLRKESRLANPVLQGLAREIQAKLEVRRTIGIRVSDSVSSPFACGLWQPMIMLPQTLVQDLPSDEIAALLAHEIAHFRRHDLFWCVGWRWMQAMFWFHPLVWKIPAAHNLACEQEADRVASGQLRNRGSYPQLLARLALRVLTMPEVETRLALNGTSQIAQRLNHLKQGKMGVWTWRHSAAGLGLAGVLFLAATGCDFSKNNHAKAKIPATVEFKKVLVVVQDEDGKPIEGATILPHGFRVKGIHGADGYGWNKELFGPPVKVTTGPDGKAYVKYPVEGIPEEKEFTGALIFLVSHPEFATMHQQDYSVDTPEKPIKLTHGIHLDVSGYFGGDHQPVTELVPNLSEVIIHPEDWRKRDNGVFAFHRMSPGGHLLQLMGRLPSGEIVFSDTLAFTAEMGKEYNYALEMKPGIRLEGRIDDKVPRPVTNGRVMMDVRPKEYPALLVIEDFYNHDEKYGGRFFWHSYRPINGDGTFVFESIPPGEADVVVLGDGFASKSNGQLQNRVNGILQKGAVMAIPQPFPLVAPVTKIEVATEPAATLEFTATTQSGRPIEGVWVGMYPDVFRMRGMFGWITNSSEEPYREMPHLPDLDFSGKTDQNGKLVMKNIPAETRGMEVDHPQFQAPLQEPKGWRDRHIRAAFSPGTTNKLNLTLEPKGSDFIGTEK